MKILIATGGSDYSFMAVEKACEMVIKPETSRVRIISVYRDMESMSAEPLDTSSEEIIEVEKIGLMQATEYALKAEEIIKNHFSDKSVEISMNAIKGSAKKKILEEAEKWGADLIVVGSLGHNFLSRLVLGSVSEYIVKNASCSVLVIRGEVEET